MLPKWGGVCHVWSTYPSPAVKVGDIKQHQVTGEHLPPGEQLHPAAGVQLVLTANHVLQVADRHLGRAAEVAYLLGMGYTPRSVQTVT